MASESRSPTTNTMASASLLTVPLEIIYQITDKLSYASQFALSLTCRELYYKVDAPRQPYTPPGENKKPYIMDDLLEIENWPELYTSPTNSPLWAMDDLFACHICLHFRSGDEFIFPARDSHSWADDRGRLYVNDSKDRWGRQCLRCSFTPGRHAIERDDDMW